MKKLLLIVSLLFFIGNAQAQTFTSTAGGAIPDAAANGTPGALTCFPITVTGIGTIGSTLGVVSVKVNITHSYVSDLVLYLKAPDGTTVTLSNQNGGAGANYTNTVFSGTAATLIDNGTAPFTGTYLPDGTISAVNNGQNANGTWSLCAQDVSYLDAGSLTNWSITFGTTPAGITVIPTQTALTLAQQLVGTGVTITNATLTCPTAGNGLFHGTSNLGIDSGIVLSSGAVKTNISTGVYGVDGPASYFASTNSGGAGDADLTTLAGKATHDACKLEFDVVPSGDTISFNYVFGSEEYTDFSCSNYNDVFAFYISGAGITGTKNIALIPGTTIPVAINSTTNTSVNTPVTLSKCTNMGAGSPFSQYYVSNIGGTSITYDGFTTVLTATSAVIPCSTYHLKLAIADANDAYYDSGVFLKAGSLNSVGSHVAGQGGGGLSAYSTPTVVRGCQPGQFTINRGYAASYALTINYIIAGTAVNGTDYTTIPSSVTIPAGSATATVAITPLTVPPTGSKTIIIRILPPSCVNPQTPVDSTIITILDGLAVTQSNDTTICPGTTATLTAGASVLGTQYAWTPAATLTAPSSATTNAVPTGTTTYTVTASLPGSGCANVSKNVTVTVANPLAPVVNSPVNYCVGDNAVPLTATGTNLRWYTDPVTGTGSTTAPTPNTATANTTTYYVSQRPATCESDRTPLTVIVSPIPTAPVVTSPTTYCQNTTAAVLTPNGTGYKWYTVPNNGTSSATITPSTTTAGTTTYYVSQTTNSCEGPRSPVAVIVNPVVTTTVSATICTGNNYSFGGTTYSAGGSYSHTFLTSHNCDSIVTLTLIVTPPLTATLNDSTCQGQSYAFGGTTYTTGGTYSHTFTTPGGCDSIVTLHLVINPTYNNNLNATICDGQSYTFAGNTYNNAGNYPFTFTSIYGCDSLVTLHLTVNPSVTHTAAAAICQGASYSFGGTNYTTAGTYLHTFAAANTCDSIVTLNLTINPTYNTSQNATICPGSSITFGGTTITAAGAYPHTFTSALGCDSTVTLHVTVNSSITVNMPVSICQGQSYTFAGTAYTATGTHSHTFLASNGCDSVVTLQLTVNPTYNNSATAAICQGDTYAFGGTNYTTAGAYPHTFSSISGCDSIVTLHLTVNPVYNNSFSASICQGNSYTFAGNSYNATGAYSNTFTSISGCDSNVTLHLTVNPVYNLPLNATICQGTAYTFAGTAYNATGSYPYTFTTVKGCDSVVTLNLTVTPALTNAISASVCNGQSYTFGGATYTAGGTYTHTFSTAGGCDSIVTLTLTIKPLFTSSINAAICQGNTYTFGGTSYTTAGAYSHIFTAANGCDSTVTLNLSINPTYNASASATVCAGDSYVFGGTTYNTSGAYPHTFTTAAGCDSIVTLHLTVNPAITGSTTAAICQGQSYTYAGNAFTATGTYTHIFTAANSCDSTATLYLTVKPIYTTSFNAAICQGASYAFGGSSYTTAGAYAHTFTASNGCDSIATLNLSINPTYNNAAYAAICQGTTYTFGGTTYSASGAYPHTFTTTKGCDSIVTLNLAVAPAITNTVDTAICQGNSYAFGGSTYTAGGTYTHTFTTPGGCDSIVTLTLNINPTYNNNATAAICQGTSYTFAGSTYTTAGSYPHTFTSALGCDSVVTLHLTTSPTYNNTATATICQGQSYAFGGNSYTATGSYPYTFTSALGCDSVVTLNLTVNPTVTHITTAAICQGTSYAFGGSTYTASGTYTYTFPAANTCDSVVTLNLTVNPTYNTTASMQLCNGGSTTFGGQTIATAGSYPHTFTTINGCDSIATLTVTISPAITATLPAAICQGSTYTFAGTGYTTGGTYTHTFTAASGCDSVVTLQLIVNPVHNDNTTATICQGTSYSFGGSTYTTAGDYPHTFTSVSGCDSIMTLHLIVNPTYNTSTTATICQGTSYSFAGASYTTSGSYPHTFTTTNGCDSIVTLNLTVNPTYNTTATAAICQGNTYTFGGTTYSATGNYPHTFTTTTGCDSVVTLNLTVNNIINQSIAATICTGQSYTFNGSTYTASGTHSVTYPSTTGCDSITTLTLTVSPALTNTIANAICQGTTYAFGGSSYTAAGTYTHTFTTSGGCDSIVTLNLTVNPVYNNTATATICNDATYAFGGSTYTTTGSYAHTFTTTSGCDSVVTLSLTVNPTYNTALAATICQGQSYAFAGNTYTTGGSYPHTFTTTTSCDSTVTLNLTVNPTVTNTVAAAICNGQAYTFNGTAYTASGTYTATFPAANTCDSVVTLNLTVNNTINQAIAATICTGQSYTFDGNTYNTSGTYTSTYPSAAGCDSITTLTLTVAPVLTNTIADAICQGATYAFGGSTYTAAGTYAHTFTTSGGCDSVVTLNLSVNPVYNTTAAATICNGSSYAFGGNTYTATGSYAHTFTTTSGCDSTVTLALTVNPTYNDNATATICQGQSYAFGGNTYTTSGSYPHTFTSALGCDSTITLALTVTPTVTNTISAAICNGQSYAFNGTSYTTAGTYTANFPAASTCDSVVTLTIIVNNPVTNNLTATICTGQSYTFNGNTYTASGTYTATYTAATGCDSTVNLALTVAPALTATTNAAICNGSSYSFGGSTYMAAGTYTHTFIAAGGCDSIVTLNLTVNNSVTNTIAAAICQGSTYAFNGNSYSTTGTFTGTFTAATGCDSTVTLNLTVNPTYNTTASASIPQGSSYSFGGNTYSATGTYPHTFTALTGCDSTVTLTLTVLPNVDSVITASICQGNSYPFNGNSYTATGTYTAQYTSANNTDSTVILHLTVKPTYNTSFSQTICNNASYTFAGTTYTSSGSYPHTFTTVAGCDSTVTLNLTVSPAISNTATASICNGSSYNFGGNSYSTSGTYTHTFTSAAGCDSVVTLTLNVNTIAPSNATAAICQGNTYAFGGSTYSTAGSYPHTFTAAGGCDSVVTLILTVNPTYASGFSDTTCSNNPYSFNGNTYSTSGNYPAAFTTVAGCDSTITLHLYVWPPVPAPGVTDITLCQTDDASPLTATGNNLTWYATATSTTPIADPQPSTTNPGQTTYYVSQTINGCESPRAAITVTVNTKPTAPVVTTPQVYCAGTAAVALTATGNSLTWYTSLTGNTTLPQPVTPSTTTPGTTDYYVTQTVNGCQSDRTLLEVIVHPVPAKPVADTFYSYCQFSPASTLTATGNNLHWYTSATGGTSSLTPPTPGTDTAGTTIYYVSQQDTGCESARTAITVQVKAKPAPPLVSSPDNICQYSTPMPLTATGQNLEWYSSATGGTGTTTAPIPMTASPLALDYFVSQTVNGCESDRALLHVEVLSKPTAQIAVSQTVFCQGDTIELFYSGTGTPSMTYDWNTGGGQIVSGIGQGPLYVVFNTAGQTTVSIQVDNQGCLSEPSSQQITVKGTPDATFTHAANACIGDTVVVALNHASDAATTYTWTFGDGAIIFGQGAGPYGISWSTPGTHVVNMQAYLNGCSAHGFEDTIAIHGKPDVTLTVLGGTTICAYDTVTLQAVSDSGSTFAWLPEQFVTEVNNDGTARIIIPQTGYAAVTATTPYGCTNTDSVGFVTQLCCTLALPDVFTPNGDGRNDVFRPLTNGHQRVAWFRITNRWGQIIFQTSDEHTGWDGTFHGVPQDMDTYYYTIKYQCADGSQTFEKKGDVILVR